MNQVEILLEHRKKLQEEIKEIDAELWAASAEMWLVVQAEGEPATLIAVGRHGVDPERKERVFTLSTDGSEVSIYGDDPYNGSSESGGNDFFRELADGETETVKIYGQTHTFSAFKDVESARKLIA